MTEAEITELLFKRDPLTHSDLALVFGHHDPDVSSERARHAAFLFHHGHTPLLLLSGGATGDDGRSEAKHMAAVAESCGGPAEARLLETKAGTTVENVSFAGSLLPGQNLLHTIRTVHLVSCPWHMRRVLHLARVAFGPAVSLLASPHEESCTESTWAS